MIPGPSPMIVLNPIITKYPKWYNPCLDVEHAV